MPRGFTAPGLVLAFSVILLGAGCKSTPPPDSTSPPLPTILVEDIRGGTGESVTFPVQAANLPPGTQAIEWTMNLRLPAIETVSMRAGSGTPPNTRVFHEPAGEGPPRFRFRVEAEAGQTLAGKELARITFRAPSRIVSRTNIEIPEAWAVNARGERSPLVPETHSLAISLIHDPVILFTFLAACVGVIFWLGRLPRLEKLFRYFPPLIWTYFVPMMCTTVGIIPDASSLYSPFMSRVILPAVLILLLIPANVRQIRRLGLKALGIMLFGTLGIVLGAIGAMGLFAGVFGATLPPDAWKGVAALSGSWIGGSANMMAVIEAISVPPSIIGPLVVVDTVLAYSWLGLLIALSAYQKTIDRHHKADSSVMDEISSHLEAEHEAHARDPKVVDIALMFGLAFGVSQVCLYLGGPINKWITGTLGWKALTEVINAYGWGILLITAAGILLSMTRLRALDYCGASSFGYVGLYLMLTTYGARANLRAVLDVPVFFGIGFVWIVIHVAVLYLGLRLLRAPVFLASTASMANIGGTASAPVVAAAYNQSMAPVGLLMAILGSVIGTPIALFLVAVAARAIMGG